MKAATGELNLTVITIVAIGAVIAFFLGVLWPQIEKSITQSWTNETNYTGKDKGGATTPMITGNGLFEFTNGNYTMTVK